MLQTSLLLMKSLNKTETPIFYFVSKGNLFDVYSDVAARTIVEINVPDC